MIWVSSKWELESPLSWFTWRIMIETTVKKQRIQRREETELRSLREALASSMHWAWLCTRRSCQAFIGAYEEQCRVTKTALCVKCLLSKHKDVICDPQNPRGSWAWLAAPATPALELWAESGSFRASLGGSLGKAGIFKFSETSCLKTISWRSNQRKILKLTSGLHMCPTGDNTHSASHENNVEHTLLFLSRKQGG